MLHAVVIAGGSGTRFWPQSRSSKPKQLLPLTGKETMLRETIFRCNDWIDPAQQWIVTGKTLAKQTAAQLPDLPESHLLAEPTGRNTLPAIGLAAIHMLKEDPDATMLVMPADHVLCPAESFRTAVETGEALLKTDPARFLLFGVPPTYPATGYGYIETGEKLADGDPIIRDVSRFREKPDAETAQQYIDSGNFFWNCGIFLWKAATLLDAIRSLKPEMHQSLIRISDAIGNDPKNIVLNEEFPQMESVSIDYGILEQADRVGVIEANFEWDDLGSWSSLPRQLGKDDDGNTIDAEHVGIDTKNCIVRAPDGHLIATIGLDDVVIVQTEDATLIAKGTDENALRELVAKLDDKWK